jgi:hypothetical protein
MQSTELDATLDVWRAASLARGRPGDGPRLARAREMLAAPSSTAYVAVAPRVVGMTLIEPGCEGEPHAIDDPASLQSGCSTSVHPRSDGASAAPCCSASSTSLAPGA